MILIAIKRILFAIPLIFIVSLLVFILQEMVPGDYLSKYKEDPSISDNLIKQYEEEFGLNKPVHERYFYWLKNVMSGDFGYSFVNRSKVSTLIFDRLLNTLILAFVSLFAVWLFAIPLGITAAVYKNRFIDRALSLLSYISLSMPRLFLALLGLLFASYSGWFPIGGIHSVDYESMSILSKLFDWIWHLSLPACIISITSISLYSKKMRACMLDVLNQEYILAAESKGLCRFKIVWKHALRNAINPMITLFGFSIGAFVNGSFIVEIIMGWPGLARLTIDSLLNQDTPVVLACVLFSSVVLIVGNLFADILLIKVDPRIRI